jgi:hypothetical protein
MRWPRHALTADWGAGPVVKPAVSAGNGYCARLGTKRTRVRSAGATPSQVPHAPPHGQINNELCPERTKSSIRTLRRELEVNLPKLDHVRADPRDDIGVEPARPASPGRSSACTGAEFVLVDGVRRGHGSGRSANSVPLAPVFAVHIALTGLSTGQPVINLGISDERPTC